MKKIITLTFGVLMILGFYSCTTDDDTETITFEKEMKENKNSDFPENMMLKDSLSRECDTDPPYKPPHKP